ncbi:hypothetical protein VPH49_21490 [Pseudomonas luteola]|uniref:hypothetical protein n=1 Tax=Pseudomonas luteola TaxID=47886 RepID=UPI00123BFF47|nr:hypothetical protein [Pseudomonas luteola]QEU26758.1 hypothetical protein FOB45_02860 [Pseudomonas luteola]
MKAIYGAMLALAVNVTHAEQNTNQGIVLVMLDSIVSGASEGTLVPLKATEGQQCYYVGKLIHVRPAETILEKMVIQGGGNSGKWAISVKQESCPDGVSRDVNLIVPLKNAPVLDDYRTGYKVLAYPAES